jgi:prepilin-type N-terminal cleavage/methylation domain-containing protein
MRPLSLNPQAPIARAETGFSGNTEKGQKSSSGFTMIELMIVVAIIGILSAIAMPRFADMIEKSREGGTKGNLTGMRSAQCIYYADQTGIWPETLDTASIFKYSLYLDRVPEVKVTGRFDASRESGMPLGPRGKTVIMGDARVGPREQSSGWLYDSVVGRAYVNSTLRDSKKIPYSYYGFE